MPPDQLPLPDPLPPDPERLRELATHFERLAAQHPHATVRVHAEIMLRHVARRLAAAGPAMEEEYGPGFVRERRRTAQTAPEQGVVHRAGC